MIICFDLDDTLLNEKKEVTDYTLDVLNECKKRGHILVINTARSLEYASNIIDIIKPHYSVLYAGALVVDENKNIIYKDAISEEKTNAIINRLNYLRYNYSIQVLGNTLSSNPEIYGILTDFSNGYNGEALKIIPRFMKIEDGNSISREFDVDFVTYRFAEWSRFSSKTVSKLNGLKVIMEKENISKEDVISFGDDTGDLPMLQGSGIGVAMENSIDSVKEKVEYIAGKSNEDGVAKFLVKYFKF